MSKFELFTEIRNQVTRRDTEISNLQVLGLDPDAQSVHILWMYPDILNMHGGRGDVMALLHFSNLLRLPCTIHRINQLSEDIPFGQADLIFFQSGDLSCVPDLNRALSRYQEDFCRFAREGKQIIAIGSSGGLLAEKTVFLDGTVSQGLGLLRMKFQQRPTVHGDDLWLDGPDSMEIIASQIQTANVTLQDGQDAFATVRYGRGNCGDGKEGAIRDGVLFTHCLGPVFTRNPRFTEWVLRRCADRAGIPCGALDPADVTLELKTMDEVRDFIEKKMRGEIRSQG